MNTTEAEKMKIEAEHKLGTWTIKTSSIFISYRKETKFLLLLLQIPCCDSVCGKMIGYRNRTQNEYTKTARTY